MPRSSVMRRPRIPSLRMGLGVRVGLAALAVLTIVGLVVVRVVDQRMHDTVRRAAIGALTQALMTGGPGDGIQTGTVSILDGTAVVDANDAALDEALPPAEVGEITVVRRETDGDPYYVALTAVDSGDGGPPQTTVAITPLGETESTLSTLRTATILGVPTVSLLLGLLAALVAGRALRPVATMRAEADAISHGTLHQRLSVTAPSAELADLAATMNDMLDRLERAATSQRQFVSDVSHEFRSPLTTVRGTVELSGAADAGLALGEIDRMDRLVGDLLTLSRLDELGRLGDKGRTEATDVDLDDVVATHVAAVRRPGLRIDTTGVGPARIKADRRAIDGLVRNLVDNAARHANRLVAVTLAAPAHGGHVELTVDDDGPGIPADQRARVFERFARLDDVRSRTTGGTGLGLAVAAAAAHAHAGTITIHDAPIGGARFVVTLPTTR
jgi:signal transduction histidine kinase